MKSGYLRASRSPVAGIGTLLLIGVVSGLVASGVKTLCEVIAPPRPPGVQSPLGNTLDAVSVSLTGQPMPKKTKTFAEPTVHFLFGAIAGAVYAGVGRKFPIVRAGYGAFFGFSFWLLAHEIALPLLGLSPTPAQMTAWEQGNELVTHGIFGVVLEVVRRGLLRRWR